VLLSAATSSAEHTLYAAISSYFFYLNLLLFKLNGQQHILYDFVFLLQLLLQTTLCVAISSYFICRAHIVCCYQQLLHLQSTHCVRLADGLPGLMFNRFGMAEAAAPERP
jgi:hypothetical protein